MSGGFIELPFPLYCVASSEALGGIVVAGGGGGVSKTGVPNGIAVMGWDAQKSLLEHVHTERGIDDGVLCVAIAPVPRTDKARAKSAEPTTATGPATIAYGHGNRCTIATVSKVERKGKEKDDGEKEAKEKEAKLKVTELMTWVTAPRKSSDDDETEQRVVCFEEDNDGAAMSPQMVAVGSSTGIVSVWEITPDSAKFIGESSSAVSSASSSSSSSVGAVTSLSFRNGVVVSATSTDAVCRIWNVNGSSLRTISVTDLPTPVFVKRSSAAKFPDALRGAAALSDNSVVVAVSRAKCGSWVSREGGASAVVSRYARITAFATDAHRGCVALGTSDGDVAVHATSGALRPLVFSGRRHAFVVTGIGFVPGSASHVVSVGLDGRCYCTPVAGSRRGRRSCAIAVAVIVAMIAAVIAFVLHGLLVAHQRN